MSERVQRRRREAINVVVADWKSDSILKFYRICAALSGEVSLEIQINRVWEGRGSRRSCWLLLGRSPVWWLPLLLSAVQVSPVSTLPAHRVNRIPSLSVCIWRVSGHCCCKRIFLNRLCLKYDSDRRENGKVELRGCLHVYSSILIYKCFQSTCASHQV